MASEYKDIVSLGVGEFDFDTPGIPVKKRLKRCKKAVHSIQLMKQRVRRSVCPYRRSWGEIWPIARMCHHCWGSGSQLIFSMRVLLNPGWSDRPRLRVIRFQQLQWLMGTPVILPLKEENQFRITPEDLEAVITPKTKAILEWTPGQLQLVRLWTWRLEAVCEVLKRQWYYRCFWRIIWEINTQENLTYLLSKSMACGPYTLNRRLKHSRRLDGDLICLAPAVIMEQMYKIHQFGDYVSLQHLANMRV